MSEEEAKTNHKYDRYEDPDTVPNRIYACATGMESATPMARIKIRSGLDGKHSATTDTRLTDLQRSNEILSMSLDSSALPDPVSIVKELNQTFHQFSPNIPSQPPAIASLKQDAKSKATVFETLWILRPKVPQTVTFYTLELAESNYEEILHKELGFRPLIKFSLGEKLTQKLWYPFVSSFFILTVFILFLVIHPTPLWLTIITFFGIVPLALCEATRFDRVLLVILFHQFEVIFLFLNLIAGQLAMWWALVTFDPVFYLVTFTILHTLAGCLLFLFDATPEYSKRNKMAWLITGIVYLASLSYWLSYSIADKSLRFEREICFPGFHCLRTRTICFVAITNMTLFLLRYLWLLGKSRNDDRLTIPKIPILLRDVRQPLRTPRQRVTLREREERTIDVKTGYINSEVQISDFINHQNSQKPSSSPLSPQHSIRIQPQPQSQPQPQPQSQPQPQPQSQSHPIRSRTSSTNTTHSSGSQSDSSNSNSRSDDPLNNVQDTKTFSLLDYIGISPRSLSEKFNYYHHKRKQSESHTSLLELLPSPGAPPPPPLLPLPTTTNNNSTSTPTLTPTTPPYLLELLPSPGEPPPPPQQLPPLPLPTSSFVSETSSATHIPVNSDVFQA